MPTSPDECLADNRMYSKDDIGKKIIFSENNDDDTFDQFKYKEYTIVGICESPLYMNFERGSTTLGSGSLTGFIYLNEEPILYTITCTAIDEKDKKLHKN